MPAAGMRRTTRVFGMKGADSARVLRSGRRLWPESGEVKTKRGNDGDDFKAAKFNTASPRGVTKAKPVIDARKSEEKKRGREVPIDGRFGIVYERRRKRVKVENSELSRRKKVESVLSVVVNPCAATSVKFLRVLASVLRYATRVRVSPLELLAFFMCEPIHGVFASHGMQFLKGSPIVNSGICQFFGITEFVPLFSVDFSAVPLYFEHLHSVMLLKSMFRSFFLVYNPINLHSDDEDDEEDDDSLEYRNVKQISWNAFKREPSETGTVAPDVIEISDSLPLHSSVKATRVTGRNGQYRNILNSRSIQKRRSSLQKRKARNPSITSLRRSNGAVASDLMVGRKSNSQLSGVTPSKKLRSLADGSATGRLKEASSAVVDLKERLDSSVCSANLLVTQSDRCYRVEGAIVTLEMSGPREWLLTVKKDGLTRSTFKAEKVMRPSLSNRFTHAIIYSLDNGYKLEFPNRQDWNVFKVLYKECSDRNPATAAKFIPVPGVREVSSYAESNSFPFHRPDTYISAIGDELTRAMARTTANYDMDSEDEEWLKKFNNEFQEHVSVDNFELIIDALEKVYYYCNPDDSFDEKSAANGCQDLGSKEVVEAVYNYWTRKRKQKRSLLLRVFQGYQSKRAPLIPKPLLRKRRSFKRQPSQFGRGNQPSVLKAIAAEQDALEVNAMLRIEEAKASANISMEIAVQKRKRAQLLAQNADLATYKATMLIKIAEAALAAESVDAVAEYFLD